MKILTVKDVSNLLKIKISTVYAWAEQGKIPCHKMNGTLRFIEQDIIAWMDSCKQPLEGYNTPCR